MSSSCNISIACQYIAALCVQNNRSISSFVALLIYGPFTNKKTNFLMEKFFNYVNKSSIVSSLCTMLYAVGLDCSIRKVLTVTLSIFHGVEDKRKIIRNEDCKEVRLVVVLQREIMASDNETNTIPIYYTCIPGSDLPICRQ